MFSWKECSGYYHLQDEWINHYFKHKSSPQACLISQVGLFSTLRPKQNGCHFVDDIFKYIFLNEYVRILLKISLRSVTKVRISNIALSEHCWTNDGWLLTHICITRPQCINSLVSHLCYFQICFSASYMSISSETAMAMLTHWGRVTHICVNKLTIIGSDNGLSPGRRQAIIWTNAGILLTGPLGTNFSEILIEI